jgi:hypothetical protein
MEWFILLIYFLGGIEVWTQGLTLARKRSTTWATLTFLALLLLFDRVLCIFPGPASDHNPPTYASCVTGITGTYYHPSLIVEMRSQ